MFLKSLELNGFKSFAQKTVLEFPLGITGVVGPNGAGKSNLIDAVKWLLGEREAKNLRGGKSEDLIFNGTPQKPRMGMAQASLRFDNSSGFFPVDFKEVSVSRQVSRDGTSKYFLNKSEARLKDIIDFFSRSRLGTRGLTVINQGESDSFVKASPEDRKLMMEEILGLREYQIKKNEAERKLKAASFNLEKATAMAEEVAPRLRMLRRQTGKWEKRVKYEEELDNLEKKYFSGKLREIREMVKEIEPVLNSLSGQIKEKKAEVQKAEEGLKKSESRPEQYEEAKKSKIEREKLEEKRLSLQKELGRLEAKMEYLSMSSAEKEKGFSAEEAAALLREIRAIVASGMKEEDAERLKSSFKSLAEKIDNFLSPKKNGGTEPEEFGEIKKIKSELAEELEKIEKETNLLKNKEEKAAEEMEEFNSRFQGLFQAVEEKRRELRALEEKANKAFFEKERIELRLDDLKGQLKQAGRKPEDFEKLEGQAIDAGESADLEKRIFRLRGELAAIGEIDEALVKETEEVEKHYDFLTKQSEDLKKAITDLKGIIKELSAKIHSEFAGSLRLVNSEFNKFFRMMFSGGSANLKVKNYGIKDRLKQEILEGEEAENLEEKEEVEEEKEPKSGIEIEVNLPKRRVNGLEMLSGGERSLVSIAVLFSLISISPPPFLVLDEIDAALDESNTRRFSEMVKEFSKKTQFIIVTHNRATMEAADVLYGVTMEEDGTSKILSLRLENNRV
jgi:chromosome segregation protein